MIPLLKGLLVIELLHRTQFGMSVSVHYLFAPLSVSLALVMLLVEGFWLKTGNPVWKKSFDFWRSIFATNFAIGVATGIPLIFAFGLNWSRYAAFVGPTIGPLFAQEAIFAFTLEAGFLGLCLYGEKILSAKLHFVTTFFVFLGAHLSAFFITAANSWMQTPKGFVLTMQSQMQTTCPTRFSDILFNPSALTHFSHLVLAAWLVGFFLIVAICAFYAQKNHHLDFATKNLKMAFTAIAITLVLLLASADTLARNIAVNNPTKMAAFEGVYKTAPNTPMYLIGWPDSSQKRVHGIAAKSFLSLLVHRDKNIPVTGLDQTPQSLWPNIAIVFCCYHLMVGLFFIMALQLGAAFFLFCKKSYKSHPWLMWGILLSPITASLANLMGWYTTEFGRQPWVVNKLLKTASAYSDQVTVLQAAISFAFTIIFLALAISLFIYLLMQKIKKGPENIS